MQSNIDQQAVNDQMKQIYQIVAEKPTTETIKGYDFNEIMLDYDKLFDSYRTTGFQASMFSQAIDEIKKMISWRLSDEPIDLEKDADEYLDPEYRKTVRCKIFLGYTSNMVSCGLRETLRFLVQHKMVDCLVTSAGGIEEDFMKCLASFYLTEGSKWECNDKELRRLTQCRIGNIVVQNEAYIKFEEWLLPIFKEMYEDQKTNNVYCSPSKIIKKLGLAINNEESIYYWAAKNDIPVFCPAFTDGAIGDMLYFFSFQCENFVVDMVQDVRALCSIPLKAKKTGVVILGGGVVKHHILNANIWRNGADFGVFVNTGVHHDGSDGGAMISEAYTWGKMKLDSSYAKIWAEATLVFPLLVAQTFYKYKDQASKLEKKEFKEEQQRKI